jgi:hypothetical protein
MIPIFIVILALALILRKRRITSSGNIERPGHIQEIGVSGNADLDHENDLMSEHRLVKHLGKGNAISFDHPMISSLESENADGLMFIDMMEEVIERGGTGLTTGELMEKLESRRSDGSIHRKDHLRVKRLLNQLEE